MGTWSTTEPTFPPDSPAYSGEQDFGYHQTSYAVIHAWGWIRRAEGRNVVIKLDILTDSGDSGYSRGYFYLKAGSEDADTSIQMPDSQYTYHSYVYWKGELDEDATISVTAGINNADSTQTTKQFTGPAVLNIPLYVNESGTVYQIEKAYANVNGTIKECDVYANVGGEIIKFE